MKFVRLLVLLIGLAGCSQKEPRTTMAPIPRQKVFDRFAVTIAFVKTSNDILPQHGWSAHGTNGYYFDSEARAKFAAYLLAHTNDFSFTTTKGNVIPIVNTGRQTSIKLIPDPEQERADFEKYGLKATQLEAGVDIKDEDANGNVTINSFCSCGVHLQKPMGGSTDNGVSGPGVSGVISIGKPDIAAMFQTKDSTLWELVELNKE